MSNGTQIDDTKPLLINDVHGLDGQSGLAEARARCKRLTVKESFLTAQLLVLLDRLPLDCSNSDLVPLAVANFFHACVCLPVSPVVDCLRAHGLALRVTSDQQVIVCNANDGALIPPSRAADAVASRIWCDALGGNVPSAAYVRLDVGGAVRAMMAACMKCVAEGFEWLPRGFHAAVVMQPIDDQAMFEGDAGGEIIVESETQPATGEVFSDGTQHTHHAAADPDDNCQPRCNLAPIMVWPDASRTHQAACPAMSPLLLLPWTHRGPCGARRPG